MDACRNNHVLFNSIIYKEGSKNSEKYKRLSQFELSSLALFLFMPAPIRNSVAIRNKEVIVP